MCIRDRSIPDDIMWEYFTMLTDIELDQINKMKHSVLNENQNPFEYKKLLGELVVQNYILRMMQ